MATSGVPSQDKVLVYTAHIVRLADDEREKRRQEQQPAAVSTPLPPPPPPPPPRPVADRVAPPTTVPAPRVAIAPGAFERLDLDALVNGTRSQNQTQTDQQHEQGSRPASPPISISSTSTTSTTSTARRQNLKGQLLASKPERDLDWITLVEENDFEAAAMHSLQLTTDTLSVSMQFRK